MRPWLHDFARSAAAFAESLSRTLRLRRLLYYAEHVLVLEREGILRALQVLDPRVHLRSLRVRTVTDGAVSKATRRVAVMLVYCDGDLPGFTRTMIEALARSAFNLVVVANAGLNAASRAYLLGRSRLVIERNNVGRDFGGYKDGIQIALEKFPETERLLIANDSLFYLPQGLDRLLADLDGTDEFIGVSEVLDHHYHVGSFLMSFGPGLLRSDVFQRFWSRYLPLGTRRWAIFRGEGALSAKLIAAGYRPRILFRADDLRPHLRTETPEVLGKLLKLLPLFSRRALSRRFPESGAGNGDRLRIPIDLGTEDAFLHLDREQFAAFPEPIVQTILARNQMHSAGILFSRCLGMPVVKRDLVFREAHTLEEVSAYLPLQDPALREEILSELRRRGSARSLGPLKALLYRHSAA